MCDWITKHSEKLEMDDLAKDLTTVKALQRKHKGTERELALIKDKVGQVSQLGQDIIDSFLSERENIEQRTRRSSGEMGDSGELSQGKEQEAGGRGGHAAVHKLGQDLAAVGKCFNLALNTENENPGVKFGEISRIVAERWRQMTDASKSMLRGQRR